MVALDHIFFLLFEYLPLDFSHSNVLSDFLIQLQETCTEKFKKTVKDDNIPIVINTFDDSPL
jgi:hypothetical protein